VYYFNRAQRYEQFLQVGQLYRTLILLSLALFRAPLCLSSSWCYICIKKIFGLHPSLYLLVSWDHFLFEHNFCNYCPILIIFHCCRQKLSADKHTVEFTTLPIVCCCTTLKNAATYTSQKLLHAVISLLLQSMKILVISVTDFFGAASLRHNNVILLPAICSVSRNDFCVPAGQCTDTLRCARNSLTAVWRNAELFAPSLWPLNSPDLSPMDYEILAVVQHCVYNRQIRSVDELKQRLINVWCSLKQSIFDEATDQWWGIHWVCVHAKGGHFKYSLWTNNVDFVHIYYIQCDLFDCYIFNYEIMPATLANTFLFILQGSALADLRYGDLF